MCACVCVCARARACVCACVCVLICVYGRVAFSCSSALQHICVDIYETHIYTHTLTFMGEWQFLAAVLYNIYMLIYDHSGAV